MATLNSLHPLFIASPVQRSGTTLLQRLLCSSPDALIFGESLANDLNTFFSLRHNKQMMIQGQAKGKLRQVLSGDVNDWIPDLLPDKSWVMNTFDQSIFQYINSYSEKAAQHGRPIWGCKQPGWPVGILQHVMQSMPGSKLLYIIRALLDCVRSAKLIGMCQDEEGIRQFAQYWSQHQTAISRQIPAGRLLTISYEQLCKQPEKVLAKVEPFAKVSNIDLNVLQHRINNYGRSHEPPPELTEEERLIIKPYIQHLEQVGLPHATIQ